MPKGVYQHKPFSEEHKRKISQAMKGKHWKIKDTSKMKKFGEKNPWWKRGKEHPFYGKKRSKKDIEKFSGKNHYNWQGGKSFEPYTINWTETLKRSIRERNNYICQLCNQYGNTVHHIDYDKKNCNLNNLITLCVRCNIKVNYNRNYWINYFSNVPK